MGFMVVWVLTPGVDASVVMSAVENVVSPSITEV
jgi:hypothetical protein